MADTKATIENGRIRIASADEIADEVIKAGVPVLDADDGYVRIGDGITQYADLPYFTMSGTPKAPVVNPDEPLKDIIINLGQNSYYMNVGDEEKLTIEVYPVDSAIVVSVESLSSIVSVRNENDNWYITAEEGGGATVVVSARGSGYNTAKETISVVVNNESYSTFADASWEEISEVAESGKASEIYNIGDTKTFTLTTGEEITVRIIGFNHDTLASGGTAGISIEMVDLLSTTYQYNSTNTNSGGWDASLLRSTLNSDVFATLPSDLQAVIKSVKKKTSTGYGATGVVDSEDKLWVVSMAEVFSQTAISNSAWSVISNYANIYTQEGSQYEFYKNLIGDTDPNGAISDLQKKRNGSNYYWWLRSPSLSISIGVWYYNYSNAYVDYYNASLSTGVALGFCI